MVEECHRGPMFILITSILEWVACGMDVGSHPHLLGEWTSEGLSNVAQPSRWHNYWKLRAVHYRQEIRGHFCGIARCTQQMSIQAWINVPTTKPYTPKTARGRYHCAAYRTEECTWKAGKEVDAWEFFSLSSMPLIQRFHLFHFLYIPSCVVKQI